jgi:hypothetical protein
MEKHKSNKYIGYIPILMTNSGAHVKYIIEVLYDSDDRLLTVDSMTGKKQAYKVYYSGDRSWVRIDNRRYYSDTWIRKDY